MSSDCPTISDRMSSEVCVYSNWSRFRASHQDVSVRARCVLLLDAGQRAGICRRNWKCLMTECVQLVPGQHFIDYWNCLFLCPVTVATTCLTEWPHIRIYGKMIIIGMFGTTTTDVDRNATFAFSSQSNSNPFCEHSYSNCYIVSTICSFFCPLK